MRSVWVPAYLKRELPEAPRAIYIYVYIYTIRIVTWLDARSVEPSLLLVSDESNDLVGRIYLGPSFDVALGLAYA